jgi:hypothetical protein
VQAGVRIPCSDCNFHFRSQSCFANNKMKQGNKRVFPSENASANHVTHSLNSPENMNVANTSAKPVKSTKRHSISVICNHSRTCCIQAMEYCSYFTILKQRRMHDTLTLPGCTSLIWYVYSSFVLVVRAPIMSTRTVHSAESGIIRFLRIQWAIC